MYLFATFLFVLPLFSYGYSSNKDCSVGPCFPSSREIASKFPVQANSTCGVMAAEEYCLPKGLDCNQICNASHPNQSHPASYMNDAFGLETFWKSVNMEKPVFLQFDFGVQFMVYRSVVTFEFELPAAMYFAKSRDNGSSFQPLAFYATDCNKFFNMTETGSNRRNGLAVECFKIDPTNNPMKQIEYGPMRDPATAQGIINSHQNQTYFVMTNLRAVLVSYFTPPGFDPATASEVLKKSLSFTVKDWDVIAACFCNGQASQCDSQDTGKCLCERNTDGFNCEKCLPLYNNRPYQVRQPCEACRCNNHSLSCHYDVTKGYGVCDNCTDNTTGDKCERCRIGSYRTLVNTTSGRGCQPCECNPYYSTSLQCNDAGVCPCKPGVGGPKCTICEDRFYNLTTSGCTGCNCDPDGSENPVCNKTTGQCHCRKNSVGKTCVTCQTGYYGLRTPHPEGCLKCHCFNKTSNCSTAEGWSKAELKTELLTTEDNTDMDGWRVVTAYGQTVTNARWDWDFNYAASLSRFLTKGFIRTNVGQEQYFSAPISYTRQGRFPYTYSMSFKLQQDNVTSPDNSIKGDVILNGTGFSQPIVYRFPTPPMTSFMMYTIPFLETDPNWHVGNTLGRRPTSDELMAVLSTLQHLYIRAKWTTYTDKTTRLADISMGYSYQSSSGNKADNVETCRCPKTYAGQFCEQCAPGYTRAVLNGSAYDDCVSCPCNRHADSCHPETFVCLGCQHNTTGDQCERCEYGLYGNASNGTPSDCRHCPCPGGPSATNQFSPTCFLDSDGQPTCNNCTIGHGGRRCENCVTGYYGRPQEPNGQCRRCNCNGNVDITVPGNCNTTTGECNNCGYNTSGYNCDVCASGFYGNALNRTCKAKPCSCHVQGSIRSSCHPSTGQCDCKPHVTGRQCDQCALNYFNITSGSGCQPCECNSYYSTSFQCNDDGVCTCKPRVRGIKCNIVVVNEQTVTNVTVKEGEDVMINCSDTAEGNGQWRNEDGSEISLSSRVKIDHNNILVFRNSSKDDAGVYKCLRGSSTHIVNLRVEVTVKVKITLRILNVNYTRELENKNTVEYKEFEDNFKKQMDIVYQNITGYRGVEIIQIRNGSIRVIFRVIVVQVINNKEERTTFKRVVIAQRIVDEAKTGWINDNLQVDTSPDAFETDAPPPKPENVTLIEATDKGAVISWAKPKNHEYYGIKGYFIEYWEFSSSKNIENTGLINGQRSSITGLKDDSAYVARVVGKNQERGQESDNIDIRTKEAVLAGWIIAVIVVFSIIFLIIIIALIIFLCRRRKRQKEREQQEMFALSKLKQEKMGELEKGQPHLKSYVNTMYNISDGSWTEFPRESLVLQDEIGSGEFGVVYKGQLIQDGKNRECAVKTLKAAAGPEEHRALHEELEIMEYVGNHPNLVNLIGASAEGDKIFVIVEFARHGSLIAYLRSQRTKPDENYELELDYVNRLRIALDVANGMAYLHEKRCVHRDLAARNVLLADDFVAKVADFGLSRDIYETGEYEKTTTGKMPTKWMAIESLELRRFTLKSDVWSFGVLLWEIETKGLMPHGAVSYLELLDKLKRGYRLEQPKGTTDELYDLMQKCWEANPDNRPNFPDISDRLETLLHGAQDHSDETP